MLTSLKYKIPSKKETIHSFTACAFPIYIWAIISLLHEIPALILRLSVWDLVGVIAYTISFALVESGIVFCILLTINFTLPPKFFRDKFIAISTLVVFLTSIGFMLAHFFDSGIRLWGKFEFVLSAVIFLTILSVSYYIVLHSEKIPEIIEKVVE